MEIRIGSMWYKFVSTPNLRDGDMKLDGQSRHTEKKIVVDAALTGQTKQQTILHEVIHAMLVQLAEDQDESFVDSLSYILYGFIRDNPKLIADMQKG